MFSDFNTIVVETDCFDDVVREFVGVDVRHRAKLDHSVALVRADVEESVAIFDE